MGLVAHLGIQTEPIYEKRCAHLLEHHEFNLVRKVNQDIGTGRVDQDEYCHKIGELSVKIISDRLVEIRFTSIFDEEPSETINITYSGSYTVWWLKG